MRKMMFAIDHDRWPDVAGCLTSNKGGDPRFYPEYKAALALG